MPADNPIETSFKNIRVERADTMEESLKTIAVKLRMQLFKKPDLLLSKGKRNRLGMRQTIDMFDTRTPRPVALPNLNGCKKLSNRRVVEDFRQADPNVKLLLDQPSEACRGKRVEPDLEEILVKPLRLHAEHLPAQRLQVHPGIRKRIRRHLGNHERRLLRGRLRCQPGRTPFQGVIRR